MLASTAVTSVLLVGIAGAVVGHQRAHMAEVHVREAASGARSAMAFLEGQISMAGFGIEPHFAFLFRNNPEASDNGGVYGRPFVGKLANATGDALAGDVGSDILELQYRDPSFMYRGSVNGTTVTLGTGGDTTMTATDAALRSDVKRGTRLLIICPGAQNFAYVHVTAESAKGDSTLTIANWNAVTWNGAPPGGQGHLGPVPRSDTTHSCYSSGADTSNAPFIVRIKYLRAYLRNVPENDGSGPRPVPYLMMSEGLLDGSGAPIESPLVRGIEDFQLAYMINMPPPGVTPPTNLWTGHPAGGTNGPAVCGGIDAIPQAYIFGNGGWVVDSSNKMVWDNSKKDDPGCAPDPTITPPGPDTEYHDVLRFNANPANIRRVRMTLVSLGGNVADSAKAVYRIPAENNPVPRFEDGLFRMNITTMVQTKNLLTRSMFTPNIASAGGSNAWGG